MSTQSAKARKQASTRTQKHANKLFSRLNQAICKIFTPKFGQLRFAKSFKKV